MLERVEFFEQFAAVLLPLVGDALRHDAFDDEAGLGRVAAGGEGLVANAQEAGLGEASLRLGEDDVGRHQPLVAGVVSAEERNHRPGPRIDLPIARHAARLRGVRRRFVGEDAVRHAADDRILVGLLGQVGQQLVDADAVDVRGDGLVEGTAIVVARGRLGVEGVECAAARPTSRFGSPPWLWPWDWGFVPRPGPRGRTGCRSPGRRCPPTSGKPLRDAKAVRRSSIRPCCSWFLAFRCKVEFDAPTMPASVRAMIWSA